MQILLYDLSADYLGYHGYKILVCNNHIQPIVMKQKPKKYKTIQHLNIIFYLLDLNTYKTFLLNHIQHTKNLKTLLVLLIREYGKNNKNT